MFGKIRASGKLFGDQYLYVVADLATLKLPRYESKYAVVFPSDFTQSLYSLENSGLGKKIVWCGASQGVIFSLLRNRIGRPISAVVDLNPFKQNKYLPVTGLKVLSPEDLLSQYSIGDEVYVMNSNYLEEIKKISMNRFNYIGVDQ
jgi:hypothetical protein